MKSGQRGSPLDGAEGPRSAEELAASERRLKAMIENSSDAIALVDGTGRLTYESPAVERIMGYRPGERIGRDGFGFVHPDDLDRLRQTLAGLVAEPRGRLRTQYRARHKDGRWVWIDAVATNAVDDPAVGAIVVNYRDVSEHKAAEERALAHATRLEREIEARRQAEGLLETALAQSPSGILIASAPDVTITMANPAALHIRGGDSTGLTGIDVDEHAVRWQTLRPDGSPYPPRHLPLSRAVLDGCVTRGEEVLIRDEAGEDHWVNVNAAPIRDGQGRVTHGIVVFHDVTARKRAEEAMRRRVAELEAVAKISSALRTALTVDEILPILLDETLSALKCEAGMIRLIEPGSESLRAAVSRGWFASLPDLPVRAGEGIGGTVFASRRVHVSREFARDSMLSPEFAARVPPGWGGVCVPLRAPDEVVGVMFVAVPLPRELGPDEISLLVSFAQIAGTALHRLGLHEETQRRLQQLQALRAVDQAITSSLDSRTTLNLLLEHVMGQLRVDAAGVLMFNSGSIELQYAAGRGFRGDGYAQTRLRLGEGFAGRAALERRFFHSLDLMAPGFVRTGLVRAEGFVAYAVLPFQARGQMRGVLEVFHRRPFGPTEEWQAILEALAAQAAIAIDNAQLFEGLQRSNLELSLAYDSTIEGWSRAMDMRDHETEGHSLRVTEMTLRLGRAVGIPEADLVHIRRGALLHDMGKLAIPDAVLLKTGNLTEDDWRVLRQHPQFAWDMLSPIEYLRPALDIPYCHHEKWDGTGYPRGLAGEQIPPAARLFSVVDVWDALTHDRTYRPAWPIDAVRAHIRSLSGSHFEPAAVDLFFHVLDG